MDSFVAFEVCRDSWGEPTLHVQASNGRFAGQSYTCVKEDVFARLADAVQGFPSQTGDRREFVLRTFDPNYVCGEAKLCFLCTDGLGHCAVDAFFRDDTGVEGEKVEEAVFRIQIEPAAIDKFVSVLRNVEFAVGVRVELRGKS